MNLRANITSLTEPQASSVGVDCLETKHRMNIRIVLWSLVRCLPCAQIVPKILLAGRIPPPHPFCGACVDLSDVLHRGRQVRRDFPLGWDKEETFGERDGEKKRKKRRGEERREEKKKANLTPLFLPSPQTRAFFLT